MVDHMSDAAQSLQVSRKTIAGAIAHDLENGSAHGARVATSPYLDNYHIDGHVNLLALADAVIAAQPPAAPVETGDFYLVPREIIDQFPEINVNNYDHDDACALNTWGCEVVTNANPAPVQRSSAATGDAFETYRETTRKVAAAREKGYAAARENLKEAWSALAMIRETVETLAPSGSVKAAEHLDGPTFMHEAEALVAGIMTLSAAQPQAVPTGDDVVNFNGRLVTWADIEIAVRGRNAALAVSRPHGGRENA